ncbi:MAG: 3-isopropylmalate dehydrogenase [Bacillota bacterium]|nr:3-isopropylmalate dehydrogenase [Bacillota bacterium]
MKIAVLKGDGIGPEVVNEAIKVLYKIGEKYNLKIDTKEALIGGAAIDAVGCPLPDETIDICLKSHAVLLGAVGGPKWDNIKADLRPEAGLLGLRKALQVYANLRPAILFKPLASSSNLKAEVLGNGLDILIVRELIGGAYFGEKGREKIEGGYRAYDTIEYKSSEIERLLKIGFEAAGKRNKKLTLVDKANVLESSRLWREIGKEMSKSYPEIELNFMYVDNAAMQLINNPHQFDVIVTENMFGDILSDEASMLTGSLGNLPSASLGDKKAYLYEPIHGSAPDIAGKSLANPIGTIMSIAMMMKYSFNLDEAAENIENAVSIILEKGYRTRDIMSDGKILVTTNEMGNLIASEI